MKRILYLLSVLSFAVIISGYVMNSNIRADEKKAAVWVKKTWELWNSEIEGELSKTCRKLSNSWKDLRFKTEHSNYND